MKQGGSTKVPQIRIQSLVKQMQLRNKLSDRDISE